LYGRDVALSMQLGMRMQGLYDSTGHAIRSILRDEGWRGFFAGLCRRSAPCIIEGAQPRVSSHLHRSVYAAGYWSTCFRDIPFMVVLFVSYEQFKMSKVRLTTAQSRRDPALIDQVRTGSSHWIGPEGG
jgi:hypothetical protein